MTPIFHLRNHA